ncbi:MAG: RIP metalloprotease RseP [Acidobacteriota bacterium]|nr:RIP metalloprotease RseP [Acidobacteriota bacterium]
MNSVLFTILALIAVLGPAVVIHEFGHFIVAKLFGMRVETFSFGFGPRLFGWRWGTTDYRLSLIPLGGYVKLGGDESNAPIEGAGESDIPARERFDLRPRWQKFLVMVAGPAMNILTALAIVWAGAMMSGVPVSPESPVVGSVAASGMAESAGLRVGDRIINFNGKDNPTWDRIRNDALLSPDKPLPLIVEREGARVPLTVKPIKRTSNGESMGELDFSPSYGDMPVTITRVEEGSGAAAAGLQVNDRLVAINDTPVGAQQDVQQAIQAGKGAPIKLTIERGGVPQEATASVRQMPDGQERLGIGYNAEEPVREAGPIDAAVYAVERNIEVLRMTGNAIGQIFTGERSARESLSGPIGIAQAASNAASEFGLAGLIGMLGFLSLNLGVVNLLPIPVLDGGAIFLLFVEAILGWIGVKLTMNMRERIQQFGFVVLLLLMGFVITNDFVKLASNWRSSDAERPAATAK